MATRSAPTDRDFRTATTLPETWDEDKHDGTIMPETWDEDTHRSRPGKSRLLPRCPGMQSIGLPVPETES